MAKGQKTGGRAKGTPNRVTAKREREIADSGLTPLDYMLTLMRDEGEAAEVRRDMAKAAAPYCHARLAINQNHVRTAPDVVELGDDW